MATGLVVVAAAMAAMTLIGPGTNLWWARGIMLVMGMGMSAVFLPAQAAAFATISPAATGRASTLFNMQRQLGGALGVALLTSVLAAVGTVQRRGGRLVPHLAAYRTAFVVSAGVALAAALTALAVRDQDAAATMVRRRGGRAGGIADADADADAEDRIAALVDA